MIKPLKNRQKQLKIKKKKQVDALKVLKPKELESIEDQKEKQIEAIKDNEKQLFESDDSEKLLRQKQLLMSYLMKKWVKYIT